MSEMTRDDLVLVVNRLMISAMEDIDVGRNEAGPTTLDLVGRIERHDAALRARLAEAEAERSWAKMQCDLALEQRDSAITVAKRLESRLTHFQKALRGIAYDACVRVDPDCRPRPCREMASCPRDAWCPSCLASDALEEKP